jgi:hypothetical protein
MTMIKRATTGRIEQFTGETDDGAITCQACSRIIVSKTNLKHGDVCPFCNHNVNEVIGRDILYDDPLSSDYDDDDEDDPDIIARPC